MYISEPATSGKVCLKTSFGDLDIELWSKECPLACRNFIQLCMEGYYDGCLFHRLVKDFIIQTGDPSGTGYGGESIYGENFKTEIHQRLKFSRRGLVGMAAEKKDQNGSQFFFTFGPASNLDKKHTLFGKVVGNTLFNLLDLNKLEVDKNERPTYIHKIIGAKILSNPFNDIKIRKEVAEDRLRNEKQAKKDSQKKKHLAASVRNNALLTFADEYEEDEDTVPVVKKLKSAHDLLDDEYLSKELAVKPEEHSTHKIDNGPTEINNKDKDDRLDKVKEKLRETRKHTKFDDSHDDDFDKAIDEQKDAEKLEEMQRVSAEIKQLQKEYKKSLRGPKEPKIEDEEASTSAGVKEYKKLHLKFKSVTKGVVKTIDPKREDQTIGLLERFKTKLDRATVHGVLFDKKVDVSDVMTQEEIILATSEDQGKIDLDAKDLAGNDWMNHWFVAPEDISGVTKARDANMKEHDDSWYPIDDPRNQINVRKRMGGEKLL